MSGQVDYFLAVGLAAMALGAVAVTLLAGGYYGDLESRLRDARRGLAAMEAGAAPEVAHDRPDEMPEHDTGDRPEEEAPPYWAPEGEQV